MEISAPVRLVLRKKGPYASVLVDMTEATEVTDATFEKDVIDRSHEVPVVVDFWAAWCGPCRSLTPVLHKLADEADGSWELATVDVDTNPMVSQGFRIQGIPAVKAFRDGKLVAEFTGALPEPQVRAWLEQLGPTPADVAFDRGRELEAAGDLAGAATSYENALSAQPGHAPAQMALSRVRLRLRADHEDPTPLRERLEADPMDVDAAIALADRLFLDDDAAGAFAPLLDIIRVGEPDRRETARVHLVELLSALPPDDPRATDARRALSRALF
jgi:putative thioredoxin